MGQNYSCTIDGRCTPDKDGYLTKGECRKKCRLVSLTDDALAYPANERIRVITKETSVSVTPIDSYSVLELLVKGNLIGLLYWTDRYPGLQNYLFRQYGGRDGLLAGLREQYGSRYGDSLIEKFPRLPIFTEIVMQYPRIRDLKEIARQAVAEGDLQTLETLWGLGLDHLMYKDQRQMYHAVTNNLESIHWLYQHYPAEIRHEYEKIVEPFFHDGLNGDSVTGYEDLSIIVVHSNWFRFFLQEGFVSPEDQTILLQHVNQINQELYDGNEFFTSFLAHQQSFSDYQSLSKWIEENLVD